MENERALLRRIEKDLEYCRESYKKASYDRTVLEEIFSRLLFGYMDIIEGLSSGLNVVSPEASTEALRENVNLLMERISDFKDCGCSNEALRDKYYGVSGDPFEVRMRFCAVRDYVTEADVLTDREKEEINNKIDEIEEICLSVDTKRNKWNKLRPYIVWTAGKNVNIAMMILPLFMTIN